MDENIVVPADNENTAIVDWEARAKKAEATIVSMKKTTEVIPVKEEIKEEIDIDKLIEEKLQAKFTELSVKKEEEVFDRNVELTNSMSLTWEEKPNGNQFKTLSMAEYDKLSQPMKRDYIKTSTSIHWEFVVL